MNGRMNNYKKSLQDTPHTEVSPELRKIRIDYQGLLAYSREKDISVDALSDGEKNRFILNSSMQEIRKLQNDCSQNKQEQFDYTKWHGDLFGDVSATEVNDAAADYAEKNPWQRTD